MKRLKSPYWFSQKTKGFPLNSSPPIIFLFFSRIAIDFQLIGRNYEAVWLENIFEPLKMEASLHILKST